MKLIQNTFISLFFITLFSLHNIANAHSMVAQQGTLNFVDNHVYVVLSLPVSAFKSIDDDNDGNISMLEFNLHRKEISAKIKENVYLTQQKNKLIMQGLLLNPSIQHTDGNHAKEDKKSDLNKSNNPQIDQVAITARYTLPNANNKVDFNIKLFGNTNEQKKYDITAKNKKQNISNKFELNYKRSSSPAFL